MQETTQKPTLLVTNPIQAIKTIFYRPQAVFEAISVKDNWSWIPFILLSIILFVPPYLYFGLIDFDWWLDAAVMPALANLSPAEQENSLLFYQARQTQLAQAIEPAIGLLIMYVVKAYYFSFATRNDEKSIQGFTDWYGAMFWVAMPMVISALISVTLLIFHDSGVQVSSAILTPLSLAFWFGIDMASPWFALLSALSIPTFWIMYLAYTCVITWTNFSKKRAIVVASIPVLVEISVAIFITVFLQS